MQPGSNNCGWACPASVGGTAQRPGVPGGGCAARLYTVAQIPTEMAQIPTEMAQIPTEMAHIPIEMVQHRGTRMCVGMTVK